MFLNLYKIQNLYILDSVKVSGTCIISTPSIFSQLHVHVGVQLWKKRGYISIHYTRLLCTLKKKSKATGISMLINTCTYNSKSWAKNLNSLEIQDGPLSIQWTDFLIILHTSCTCTLYVHSWLNHSAHDGADPLNFSILLIFYVLCKHLWHLTEEASTGN